MQTRNTQMIALIGRKGGITKTTLTANLGAALAGQGFRVVLIESDGQGNLSKLVGLASEDRFYSVIEQSADWADALLPAGAGWHPEPPGELWVLPSGDANLMLAADPTTGAKIDERFEELRGWADYVLIDTSPAIDQINNAWFYVADWLLLPTLCERPSIDQLRDNTWAYIDAAKAAAESAGRRAAQVRGIVPNRYTPNTHVDRVNASYLQRLYGERCRIFPMLRNAPIWNTAAQLRMSITALVGYDENIGYRRQAMLAAEELQPIVDSLLSLQAVLA